MTTYYLDTSVAARILLGHSPAAVRWFADAVGRGEALASSRLLGTELTRVSRRERLTLDRRDEVLDHLITVLVTPAVFRAADAIEAHVKTLDALHLASAMVLDTEDVTVVTHDVTMARVAADVGLSVLDPVTDDPGRSAIEGRRP